MGVKVNTKVAGIVTGQKDITTPLMAFLFGWNPNAADCGTNMVYDETVAREVVRELALERERLMYERVARENALGAVLRTTKGIFRHERVEESPEERPELADLPSDITADKSAKAKKKGKIKEDCENRQGDLIERLQDEIIDMYTGGKPIVSVVKQMSTPQALRYITSNADKYELLKNIGVYMAFVSYASAVYAEKNAEVALAAMMQNIRFYTQYLERIPGIGVNAAATIMAYFDLRKAIYPSAYVSYAGYGVEQVAMKDEDGQQIYENDMPAFRTVAMSLRNDIDRTRDVIDAKGESIKKSVLPYSPRLRARLYGAVLFPLILSGKSEYAAIWRNEKVRQDQFFQMRKNEIERAKALGVEPNIRPNWPESAMHAMRRAQRKMARILIEDLWLVENAFSQIQAPQVPWNETHGFAHSGTRPFMTYVAPELAAEINKRIQSGIYMLDKEIPR